MDLMAARRRLIGMQEPIDLLNGVTWINGYYLNDYGVVTENAAGKYTEMYIPVESGKSYIITGTAVGTAQYDRVHAYNSQKEWQSMLYRFDWAIGAVSSTITIPSQISYIRLSTEATTTLSMFEVENSL